ncbi:hypothetical protein MHYP_G00036130 [Metynnis hypsauchen]
MARNFTVAWLSQSSHSSTGQEEKALSLDVLQSNGLCLVPPPSQKLCEAQTEETKQTPYSGLHDVIHNAKNVEIKTPSSPTNSCGYTSDSSESEVCEDSEGETGPNRRVRTKFTSYQISRLEETFTRHKYLGATQRKKMAEKLHLSETQVKTWFQNRRMKLKREVQDSAEELRLQLRAFPRCRLRGVSHFPCSSSLFGCSCGQIHSGSTSGAALLGHLHLQRDIKAAVRATSSGSIELSWISIAEFAPTRQALKPGAMKSALIPQLPTSDIWCTFPPGIKKFHICCTPAENL